MPFDPNSTKARIFMAGIEVFAEKGFKGATVREICDRANSLNMNSINYYFKGKSGLYKAILDVMFAELGNRIQCIEHEDEEATPEQRLCDIVKSYCAMVFSGGEVTQNMLAIYNHEIAQPSPFLPDLIDRHLIPQNEGLISLVGRIMGPDTPRWLLRDCGVSVFSQAMYYSTTWVIFSRVNPDHPGMEAYHEHLAKHICRFSLAGIREMKRAFHAGELVAPPTQGEDNAIER